MKAGGTDAAAGAGPVFRRASAVLAAVTAAGGLAVLCGWVFGVQQLRSLLPGLVTMKANTAACFLLSGAGLWLLQAAPVTGRAKAAARAAACLVLLVAGLTLLEYAAGRDLGLDRLLISEPPGAVLTSAPGAWP